VHIDKVSESDQSKSLIVIDIHSANSCHAQGVALQLRARKLRAI